MNDLYAAYDRLTPADLQRVAGALLRPDQRDRRDPRIGDLEMTATHRATLAVGAASPRSPSLATLAWLPTAEDREAARPSRRLSLPSRLDPAGRPPVRLPGRLAGRPAGQGRARRPDRRDGRRGGHEGPRPTSRSSSSSTRWPRRSRRACRKEVTVFAGEVHRDNLAAYVPLVDRRCSPPPGSPPRTSSGSERGDRLPRRRPSAAATTRSWASGPCRSSSTRTTPTATSTGGRSQGLKSITLDDVKAFHRDHYTRGGAACWAWPGGPTSRSSSRSSGDLRLAARRRGRASRLAPARDAEGARRDDRREAGRLDGDLARLPDRRHPPRRRLLRPGRRQLVPRRAPDVQRQADARPARQAGAELRRLLVHRGLHPGGDAAPSPSRTTRAGSRTSRSGSARSRTTRPSSRSGRLSGSSTAWSRRG